MKRKTLRSAVLFTFAAFFPCVSATHPIYSPPVFPYADLLNLESTSHEKTLLQLRLAVAHVGLLAIDSVPSLDHLKTQAVSSAAGCFQAQSLHGGNAHQASMSRGDVVRSTLARIRPYPLVTGLPNDTDCVQLERRNDLFGDAVHSVVHTVAALLSGGVKDIVGNATKVEHWHAYTSKVIQKEKEVKEEMTLNMHVDKGLLVAFTSAMKRREDGELQEDDSFVVQLADGRVVALDNKGDGNRVYIMFGDEAARALSAVSVVPFRAVPHAVRLKADVRTRIWFGAMYLMPQKSDGKATTLKSLHSTIGCGPAYETVELASGGCEKGEEFCWLQCMKKPSCPGSSKVHCYRADRSVWTPKDGMCIDCTLECETPSEDDDAFCNGMQTSMFMDGLSFTMKNPRKGCLVFLTGPFVMDSYVKYLCGLLVAFMLSFLLEAIPVLRQKHMKSVQGSKVASAFILIGQVTLAYLVMLLAMSYSVHLLGSVVLGIVVGHVVLHEPRDNRLVVEGSCHMPLASDDEATYVALSEES